MRGHLVIEPALGAMWLSGIYIRHGLYCDAVGVSVNYSYYPIILAALSESLITMPTDANPNSCDDTENEGDTSSMERSVLALISLCDIQFVLKHRVKGLWVKEPEKLWGHARGEVTTNPFAAVILPSSITHTAPS